MMSMVRTIDRHLYGVFQKFPHMESALRAAFAKDLWIAAALIAVLYGLQLLGYISLLVSAMLDENSTLGAIIRVPSQIIGTPVESAGVVVVVIYTVLLFMVVVQFAISLKPLRKGFREGWLNFLAGLLLIILGSILSGLTDIISTQQALLSLVVASILLYILYEVRRDFKI